MIELRQVASETGARKLRLVEFVVEDRVLAELLRKDGRQTDNISPRTTRFNTLYGEAFG